MIAGMVVHDMEPFLVGALQLLTAIIIIGWVWSVIWGAELVHRSFRRGTSESRDMDGSDQAPTTT